MIPGLKPIPLLELKAISIPKTWIFEGYVNELPSLIPIKGKIIAEVQGEILTVKGDLYTIIELACDSCLESFNQILKFNSKELIWIGGQEKTKTKIKFDKFAELLSPFSDFDPERWAFEQLSLQMPLLRSCGMDCKGAMSCNQNNPSLSNEAQYNDPKQIDPRWSELKKLLKP